MSRVLGPTKIAMLITDVGFLLYWAIAFAHVIPPEWAYKDYTDPIISDWNYSFVVLDLAASATGLACLCRSPGRRTLMTVSLTLTSVAGLQAIAFWTLRGDFSPVWWVPNLFLLLFPIPALVTLVCTAPQERAAS
ncbi:MULTISPECIES: DUF5360 family protein [Nocardia]|uniref:DUF5360 family protein n=1 Tax=Nocardia implantans TaxID=3108168 RepID=A0ABU6AQ00_9NOCA|nr:MULTISPECIES: DUF5360 family protein [unclassified Nocardia]MBF6189892.1 DUF5360 family protein [Nocardia beijingensis]MEA3526873.1 DUF5360 family protein [Nocardia sp. CDC192]MEB3509549.1 DUF5360 family protein [Nocardia sp. CDC186]